MAGSEYSYRIRFFGQAALTDAQTFKKQLEKTLGTITFKTKMDISGVDATLRNAQRRASRASGEVTEAAMKATVNKFTRYAQRTGATEFIKPFEDSLAKALASPSKAGVTAVNQLEQSMRVAQRSTMKLGYTLDEYLGASTWEKRFAAIQAAQRRLWGVRGLGYQLAGYGQRIMAAGAVPLAGAAAAMKEYVDYAGPLNRAARNLDLNAKLTEELDSQLRSLAGTMSYFTPEVQAEVLYKWAAATGEVIDSQEGLNAVLARSLSIQKLMVLGAVDETVAVEAVTDVISQYGLNVAQTGHVVDTFITVAANSKAEVGDLAMAFTYAGTRARAANTSFEETAAIFELLSAAGLRGSRAGRGVSRLIENLIAPSNVAKKAMEELFMDTFGQGQEILVNAQGQFVGLGEAIKITADATEELTEAERANYIALTTTENAARALTPLIEMEIEARRRGISIIDEFTAKQMGMQTANREAAQAMMEDIYGFTMNVKTATETAADYWFQYTNSVEGRMDRVKAAWAGAIDTIGKEATAALLPKLEWLVDQARNLADIAEESPWMMDALVWGGGLLVGIGALVTALGKGLALIADVKTILMGRQMLQSADKNVTAATEMMASSVQMIEAAALNDAAAATMLKAAQQNQAAATTSLVAGKGGGASGLLGLLGLGAAGGGAAAGGPLAAILKPLLGPLLVTGLAGYAGGSLASELLLKRSIPDMLTSAPERMTGRRAGERLLEQGASAGTVQSRINQLQSEVDALLKYYESGNTVFGKTLGGMGWADIPDEYKGVLGIAPSGTLLKEAYEEANAELQVLLEAMREYQKEAAPTLRWQAQAEWWALNIENYKLTSEGIKRLTYEEKLALKQQEAFDREMILARNVLQELGEGFNLSEDAIDDWAATFFDGVTNVGLGMSSIEMAIQMMSKAGQEIGEIDMAIAAGKEAQQVWGSLFAGSGEYRTYGEAQGVYEDYLTGLQDLIENSKALTAAQLQWEIDEYRRSYEVKEGLAADYYQQTQDLSTRAAETADSWVMQFAGSMDYSVVREKADEFQNQQQRIIDAYTEMSIRLGVPIDFTALEFALAENAAIWEGWASRAMSSVEDVVETLQKSALSSGWSAWEGLAGIMGTPGGPSESQILAGYYEFEKELEQMMSSPEFLALSEEQQRLRVAAFLDANQEETSSYKDAIEERKRLDKEWVDNRKNLMEQAQKGFKNLVQEALKPTEVTAEDLGRAGAGTYLDKWDEEARRMRAALAGSQEWDWMIPGDVKMGGPENIARWGEDWLDNFYAGMMPDAVNWGAFVEQFKSNLKRQAGQDRLIDRAIEELAKEGITATSGEVLAALGLESPFQKYFFGGLSAEDATSALQEQTATVVGGVEFKTEDVTTPGTSWASSLISAMDAQLSASDLITPISKAWSTQLTERGSAITSVGETLGAKIWAGLTNYVENKDIVDTIVAIVLKSLAQEAEET